jgi:hypothetical protein
MRTRWLMLSAVGLVVVAFSLNVHLEQPEFPSRGGAIDEP